MIPYAPIPISGSQVQTTISGYPDTRSVVIYNESPYFVQVSLTGSGVYGLAAYTADAFQVFSGFTGGIVFNPTSYIAVNSGATPASIIFVQAYGSNEPLTKLIMGNQGTGYPISLNRLQNLGNGVNLIGGTAEQVQNDGNVAGASVVEATVNGDTASAVSLSNNGHFSLGTILNPGLFQLIGSIYTNLIATTGIATWPNIITNLLTAQSGNDIGLHVGSGQRVDINVNGTDTFSVNSSGANLLAGKFNFQHLGITDMSLFGPYTTTTTPTFFNHNLGQTPDLCLLTIIGTSASPHNVYWDKTTITSTQVKLTSDSTFTNGVYGLAFKF